MISEYTEITSIAGGIDDIHIIVDHGAGGSDHF
jgi:hypothetical protein